MVPSINLVQQISLEGAVPADRNLDHLRRIGTGLFVGSVVGTIGTVLFADLDLTQGNFWVVLVVMIIVALVCLLPWAMHFPPMKPIPVVARTLGTDESPEQRYVQRGGAQQGLLVPVVVHPLDGSPNFRSIILLRDADPAEPRDPVVGSLLALQQNEEGMGELSNVETVSAQQQRVIDQLTRHPKQLSNDAPILPMRRGTMERHPWWAGLQWWGSIAAGVLASVAVVLLLAG
ncbi:MAG: hypothetical protein ACTH1Z_00430 [Ancrocorticia sp.]|uniref:hypothetical protein n=1 Tax=Ancrocorticia sp. TaxID=2593684 RepID=UPI003F912A8E